MAKRYGRSFNVNISYIPEYIETTKQLTQLLENSNKTPVIIDCVDNGKTRLIIKNVYDDYADKTGNTIFSISSGNEETAGQVVFSYRNKPTRYNIDKDANQKCSPDYFDIFPTSELDKLPSEVSCAEAAVSAPQNIHTNLTAANILFGFVNKLLNNKPIEELVVFFDITTQKNAVFPATQSGVTDLLKMIPNNGALFTYVGEASFDREEATYPPSLEL